MMGTSFVKRLAVATAVAVIVAGNVFSQGAADSAYVPFVVNVDAVVTASRDGAETARMTVEAGEETMLAVYLGTTSVRHGGAIRQNGLRLTSDTRGNINLRLPIVAYGKAEISLHSITGRRIMRGNADAAASGSGISRANVAPGVYMLSVKGTDGNTFTSRLTHRGGKMNIRTTSAGAVAPTLKKDFAGFAENDGEWDIRVSAAAGYGYDDHTYTLALEGGATSPLQEINLQEWDITEDDFRIAGLTLDNYPKVDGSTSADPLNKIIACRLLGFDYQWKPLIDNGYSTGTSGVIPQISQDSITELNDRIKSSQTHESFINLIDRNADITISARKMSADERAHAEAAGVSLIETPIALDALVFIVNDRNTIQSLTTKEIQDIYTSKITNWDEVGGGFDNSPDEFWPINPYIRNANSGSQELMESLVMKDLEIGEFDLNYNEVLFTMAGPLDAVMRNNYAICYTVYYYKEFVSNAGSLVKTIAVNGIHPNWQTISNRSYPYFAEVYAVIRSDLDQSSMAYKLYEWLQTNAGKQVIAESGYVPYN